MRLGERADGMVVGALPCVRYAITAFNEAVPASSSDARRLRQMRWAADVHRWTAQQVQFIQLREKYLDAGELYDLSVQGMQQVLASSVAAHPHLRPQLLVNSRPDIAAAAGADGVHLTGSSGELTPAQVRAVFLSSGLSRCVVSVGCHTLKEVAAARDNGADLLLFAPVFGKQAGDQEVVPAAGLDQLHQAVLEAGATPLLALGGVTADNTAACLRAGAAGVAAIRLFA